MFSWSRVRDFLTRDSRVRSLRCNTYPFLNRRIISNGYRPRDLRREARWEQRMDHNLGKFIEVNHNNYLAVYPRFPATREIVASYERSIRMRAIFIPLSLGKTAVAKSLRVVRAFFGWQKCISLANRYRKSCAAFVPDVRYNCSTLISRA